MTTTHRRSSFGPGEGPSGSAAGHTAGRPQRPQRPQRPKRRGLWGLVDTWSSMVDGRPGTDYLLLRFIVFALIGVGVLMAFSASMATSWVDTAEPSVWSQATRQVGMVVAGLVVLWMALKTPPRVVRRLAGIFLIAALVLLILVLTPLGTGRETVGSQSWIYVGPISIQPSEIARVAIAIFGAALLADRSFDARRLRTLDDWVRDPFIIYIAVSLAFFVLIILQGDVGMGVSFALVVALTLFFAGMDWRAFLIGIAAMALGGVILFTGGGYRSNRFHTYFDALTGRIEDTQGTGFQSYQGFLSLADGGFFGVGLGQSRAKWFYLPEARNDFVFAIVGEEMGFWGAGLVIVLFAFLGFFGIRTAMRAQDQFQALMAAALTAGVVSQAFVNISYVIGLLPVTGIQLPMISSGGSATIITIGSMGLLINVARHEPEHISSVQNYGRPIFDRIFGIQEPEPAGAEPRGGRRRVGRHGLPDAAAAAPIGGGESPRAARRLDASARRRSAQPGQTGQADQMGRTSRASRGNRGRDPRGGDYRRGTRG